MNKDSWIALIIANIITVLAATPLYYARGPIEWRTKFSEGSDKNAFEPMKRTNNRTEPTSSILESKE